MPAVFIQAGKHEINIERVDHFETFTTPPFVRLCYNHGSLVLDGEAAAHFLEGYRLACKRHLVVRLHMSTREALDNLTEDTEATTSDVRP